MAELADWVEADHNQQKGECVLLVHGADKAAGSDAEGRRVFDILAAKLPLKQAAALAAKITGVKKKSALSIWFGSATALGALACYSAQSVAISRSSQPGSRWTLFSVFSLVVKRGWVERKVRAP